MSPRRSLTQGHEDLGRAVLAFVAGGAYAPAPPPRSTARQLTYILSKRTGVAKETALRQLGIAPGTIRRWITGRQNPSKANQAKIQTLYERFWNINHDVTIPRRTHRVASARAPLRIENRTDPSGIVIHQGRRSRVVNPLEIPASSNRKWTDVLKATTPSQAFYAFVKDILGPSPWPSVPEYLDFLEGDYAISLA